MEGAIYSELSGSEGPRHTSFGWVVVGMENDDGCCAMLVWKLLRYYNWLKFECKKTIDLYKKKQKNNNNNFGNINLMGFHSTHDPPWAAWLLHSTWIFFTQNVYHYKQTVVAWARIFSLYHHFWKFRVRIIINFWLKVYSFSNI